MNGKSLGANVENAQTWNDDVIRPVDRALSPEGGLAILRGNLCPDWAVIKQSAASPDLLQHRGKATCSRTMQTWKLRWIRIPPIDRNTILVMKNGGPKGAPGSRNGVGSRCRGCC